MKYFIGAVPPDDIKQKIIIFQDNFYKDKIPPLVEPHITIKSPGGLTSDPNWIKKTKKVINDFNCFSLKFTEIGMFENDDWVIFLKPQPTNNLIALHKRLITALNVKDYDFDAYFENDNYHPHLTLARGKWSTMPLSFSVVKNEARVLLNLPEFKIKLVRIYRQKEPGQSYDNFVDIPLKCTK